MTRFVYVLLVSIPLIIFYLLRIYYIEAHPNDFTEEQRYVVAQEMVNYVKKNGRIETEVFGTDNLPDSGGYVMYPNHQGKYDVLGIIYGHEKPCSFIIDEERSKLPIANEFTMLLKGFRLNKADAKQQVQVILNVVDRVSKGARFIIFPEGGYANNHNSLQEFMPGSFKCSIRSKTPIVPVALIDSYKPFGINSLRKVKTQVHFLKAIPYEEYRQMKSREIAEMVRSRINDAILEHLTAKERNDCETVN